MKHNQESSSWTKKLVVDEVTGRLRGGLVNVTVMLKHHPDYAGRWSVDSSTGNPRFNGKPIPRSLIDKIRVVAPLVIGKSPTATDVRSAIRLVTEEIGKVTIDDGVDDAIRTFISDKQETNTADVLAALNIHPDPGDHRPIQRVGRVLRDLGWRRKQKKVNGVMKWVYLVPYQEKR